MKLSKLAFVFWLLTAFTLATSLGEVLADVTTDSESATIAMGIIVMIAQAFWGLLLMILIVQWLLKIIKKRRGVPEYKLK